MPFVGKQRSRGSPNVNAKKFFIEIINRKDLLKFQQVFFIMCIFSEQFFCASLTFGTGMQCYKF